MGQESNIDYHYRYEPAGPAGRVTERPLKDTQRAERDRRTDRLHASYMLLCNMIPQDVRL